MENLPDATKMDPIGHRIVFEDDHVRILEVKSKTGQRFPMHSHAPRVVVPVVGYRIRSIDSSGNESAVDRRPGEAIWMEYEEHEAEVLIGPTHVLEIEIKSAG